jgi:RNA polymerase sigma factor (sigma-70 family)
MTASHDIKSLITNFLSGDTSEHRALRTQITRYVYQQKFGSNHERDDLVSDVMLTLLSCFRENRFRGDSIQALNVFIYMTIRNQIARRLMRQWRTGISLDDHSDTPSGERAASDKVADQQLVERIYASLDPACRQLLWHKFHLQWSDQEIAESMNKSKNAISTSICRCLDKIRKLEIVKGLQ